MKIKKYFWSKIDLIITFLLLILIMACWFLGKDSDEPYKSLFINLTAGLIGSVITIWGIEFLHKKQLETKWNEARKVAKDDILQLKNMLVSYISNPMGYNISKYIKDNKNLEEWSGKAIKDIAIDMSNKNLKDILNNLNINQWRQLKMNLPHIRNNLLEKLEIYNSVLPPEILGQILKIKQHFDNFYNIFNLVPELFTENETNWPRNDGGVEKNKSTREAFIVAFSRDLEVYFKEINTLISLLEEVEF